MDLPEYCQSLRFHFVGPASRPGALLATAARLLQGLGLPIDAWNTRLPCESTRMRRRLRALPRRAGGFAIAAVVNRAVEQRPLNQSFVALGIGSGLPLVAAMCGNPQRACLAIDVRPSPNSKRAAFDRAFEKLHSEAHRLRHVSDSDIVNDLQTVPIGYCSIGSDLEVSVLERLQMCEPHLAENAYLHVETDRGDSSRQEVLHFLAASRNQYRVLLDCSPSANWQLSLGGVFLFQLLGRNRAANASQQTPARPLAPAA